MNDLTTPQGFINTYFQLLPYFATQIEAFNYLNNYCKSAFGSVLYENYNDFKAKNFNAGKTNQISSGTHNLERLLNKPTMTLTYLKNIDRLKITLGEFDEVAFYLSENNILSKSEIYKVFIDKIFLDSMHKN